jgi:hypothetical protein
VATRADWEEIFAQFTPAKENGLKEFARSTAAKDSISNWVTLWFREASNVGYRITSVMLYDNATNAGEFFWTEAEVQSVRDELDARGHADVRLMFNARNDSPQVRAWCSNPLVQDILLEANPQLWFDNVGKRQQLLKWIWAEPSLQGKRLIFQLPARGAPEGGPSNYQLIRRWVRWLSTDLMSVEFVRSPRVVFLPITYNGDAVPFYPESEPGDEGRYVNSLTGVALSLIEQKDLFEGRRGLPTEADADSYVRSVGAGGVPGAGGAPGASGASSGYGGAGEGSLDGHSGHAGSDGVPASSAGSGAAGELPSTPPADAPAASSGRGSGCAFQREAPRPVSAGLVGLLLGVALSALRASGARRRSARRPPDARS